MDLIEKQGIGIFGLLDDSCKTESDDNKLLAKIKENKSKNPMLLAQKVTKDPKPTFIIQHTAKPVEYTILGFRDKNKDEVSVLLTDTLSRTKN